MARVHLTARMHSVQEGSEDRHSSDLMGRGPFNWSSTPDSIYSDGHLHPDGAKKERWGKSGLESQTAHSQESYRFVAYQKSHQRGQCSVIYLRHKFILSEILPERYALHKMILVNEVVWTNHWECVTGLASWYTSHEKSTQQNQRQEAMSDHFETWTHHIMSMDVFHGYNCLLGSSEESHGLPEQNSVEEIGISCVYCKSIWADSRRLIHFSCLFLVNQATFDHPPANCALKTSQSE